MMNSLPKALATGVTQTASHEMVLNYNPSRGFASDLVESGVDYFGASLWQTGAGIQTGEFMEEVAVAREGDVNFAVHSQGALLSRSGIYANDWAEWESLLRKREVTTRPTFVLSGSPVNNSSMASAINEIGFVFSSSYSRNGDVVSEVIGGNHGNYVRGRNRIEDTRLMPHERLSRIPVFLWEEFVNRSHPHSYGCNINCGDKK